MWRCPICGLTARIPADTPRVTCPCGWNGTAAPAIVYDRVTICRDCSHYGSLRCDQVDQGCRQTFIQLLRDEAAACPLSRW